MHPLLDEGFRHGGDVAHLAVQPDGGIDAVGQEVSRHAGAGCLDVEPPQGVPPGEVFGDGPVLQEVGPVVEDLAEAAFVDELLGHRDGGDAAVVVPDRVDDLGLLDRLAHLFAFGDAHRQGLFAEDHLAVGGAGEGDLLVEVVGDADVDGVDVLPLDELPPVGLDRLVAPLVGERLDLLAPRAQAALRTGRSGRSKKSLTRL